MTDEQTKQAILGFTEFFKGITGNQDLKIPSEIAEKYGIKTMNYKHPKCYKGIRQAELTQDCMKVFVENNCLKCSEFCGKEHDFENCKPLYDKCPKPLKYPPYLHPQEFIKLESEE